MKTIEDAVRELGGVWPGNNPKEVYLYKLQYGRYVASAYDQSRAPYICTRYGFEECAKRLRNEPDWKDAPDWAVAKAQDSAGEWYWYEVVPRPNTAMFKGLPGKSKYAGDGEVIGDWRDTFKLRPEEKKMEEQAGQTTVDENLYKDVIRYRYLRDEDNWGQDDDDAWAQLGELHAGQFDDFVDARMMAIEDEFVKRVNDLQSAPTEDWHVKGEFPPVGTVCEYTAIGQDGKVAIIPGHWYRGTIIAYHDGYVWTSDNVIRDNVIRRLSSTQFRPLKTERERWVEKAYDIYIKEAPPHPETWTDVLKRIYDAGLAKMPEDK